MPQRPIGSDDPKGPTTMDSTAPPIERSHEPPIVRPIRPDDRERLVRFHQSLSSETTRLRFFGFHPRLADAELERFTNVDHLDREALVTTSGNDIVGVGRYDRLDDSDVAEVAFVVADPWQGQGIGTRLLQVLADLALQRGITELEAMVLPENHHMLALFLHSGFPAINRFDGGVVHVYLALAAAPSSTGDA